MPDLGRDPPRVLSPLWVISLFLGLSEGAVTIAVTQAQGWIQSLLSIFAVIFPTFVAAVFFLILWKKNAVLYAPGEFAGGATVTEYAEAMTRHAPRAVAVVENALLDKVSEELKAHGTSEEQLTKILEMARNAADRTFISVDTATFAVTEEDRFVDVPVEPKTTTVQELTDTVYFALAKRVPAYTYGTVWLLRDDDTKQVYDKIGTAYARRELRTYNDGRSLSDVDIKPGARLTVVPARQGPLRRTTEP